MLYARRISHNYEYFAKIFVRIPQYEELWGAVKNAVWFGDREMYCENFRRKCRKIGYMKKLKGPSVSGQPEIPNVKTIESYKKMLEEANYAEKFYKKLGQSIIEFDLELGSGCEVAIHLAGFNDLIIIEDMEFFNPSLICFIGRTVEGRYVKVVQHVHQINIMLTSFTRQNPQEPKRTFDFSIDTSETGEH